jgi:NitT/TauT family transport system substrate-binding protein
MKATMRKFVTGPSLAFLQKANLWVFGLALAVLLGWMPGQTSAADKALWTLDWAPYAAHTGYWHALEEGFFKRAGIDVKIIRGYGSADTIKRIAAKRGDFGFADTGTLVVARAKGAKVKSLGVLHNNEAHSVYALKSSGIRSVKDLEGRHYGDSKGGSTASLFPALAAVNGVKNWKFTHLAPTAKNPGLLGKTVDFIATYSDVSEGMRRAAKKMGDVLIELRWSNYGLTFHGNGIVAHDDTIATRPDLTGRFVNTVFAGVADAIKNPNQAVDNFIKNAPTMNRDILVASWDMTITRAYTPETKIIGVGGLSTKKMQATIDIITKWMKVSTKAKITDIYAPQFLKKHLP